MYLDSGVRMFGIMGGLIMSNQPSDPLQCPFCPIRMGDESQLPDHIELRHPSDQTVPFVQRWLKENGWLWHESHVITPECMDELESAINAYIVSVLEGIEKEDDGSVNGYRLMCDVLEAAIAKYKEVS